MPHVSKVASLRIKNLDDFVYQLKRTGAHFADGSAEDAVKKVMYGKAGSGSMVYDAGKAVLKNALPFKTKTGETVGKKVTDFIQKNHEKIQHHLADLDVKGGNAIVEKLDNVKANLRTTGNPYASKKKQVLTDIHNTIQKTKEGVANKAKDAFTYEHEIPLAKNPNGIVDQNMKVKVPGLSAPLEKTKKAVLPLVGAMTVSSKISDAQEKMNEQEKQKKLLQKGGDTVKKVANSREELIDKIASALSDKENTEAQEKLAKVIEDNQMSKIAGVAQKASEALKFAAAQLKEKDAEIEKLAIENKRLHLESMAKERVERATKLAEMMNEKGMIKKADIQKQINDIVSLEDDAYIILKQAIENTSIPEEKNGIDSLTFLGEQYNIENRKRTLQNSIEDEF